MDAGRDSVELRTDIPAAVAETLDAESLAEGITRGQLVNRLLLDWHARRRHAHMLLARVARRNPAASEDGGRPPA
jgi:hypothetical protein